MCPSSITIFSLHTEHAPCFLILFIYCLITFLFFFCLFHHGIISRTKFPSCKKNTLSMPKFRTLWGFMWGWVGNKRKLMGYWWEQRNLMRTWWEQRDFDENLMRTKGFWWEQRNLMRTVWELDESTRILMGYWWEQRNLMRTVWELDESTRILMGYWGEQRNLMGTV